MTVTLEISDELYAKAAELASAENSSVEALVREAIEREVLEVERFRLRAARGRLHQFRNILERVPDVPAHADDLQ